MGIKDFFHVDTARRQYFLLQLCSLFSAASGISVSVTASYLTIFTGSSITLISENYNIVFRVFATLYPFLAFMLI